MYDEKNLLDSSLPAERITKSDISDGLDIVYSDLSDMQKDALKVSFEKAYKYSKDKNLHIGYAGSVDFIDTNNREKPFLGFVFKEIEE